MYISLGRRLCCCWMDLVVRASKELEPCKMPATKSPSDGTLLSPDVALAPRICWVHMAKSEEKMKVQAVAVFVAGSCILGFCSPNISMGRLGNFLGDSSGGGGDNSSRSFLIQCPTQEISRDRSRGQSCLGKFTIQL